MRAELKLPHQDQSWEVEFDQLTWAGLALKEGMQAVARPRKFKVFPA